MTILIDLLSLNTHSAKYVAFGHLQYSINNTATYFIMATRANISGFEKQDLFFKKNVNIIILPDWSHRFFIRYLVILIYYYYLSIYNTPKLITFSGYFFPLIKNQITIAQNPLPLLIDNLQIKLDVKTVLKNKILRFLMTRPLNNNDKKFIFNSLFMESLYKQHLGFIRNYKVLYQGVDIPQYQTNMDTKKNDFLILSTISRHKKTLESLKVFKEFHKHPDFSKTKVHLVGKVDDLDYLAEIQTWIYQNKLVDCIIFEGFVSEDKKRHLLDKCSFYISMSVCESFGIPLLEAQAHGLIPILQNGTAQTEISNNAAIYLNDGDSVTTELVNKILDYEYRSDIISKCISNAQNFQWHKIYSNQETIFE